MVNGEIDELLELEEIEIIDEINFDYPAYRIRNRPNHFEAWNEIEFKNRFRLSRNTVQMLVPLLQEHLQHRTNRNHAIPPLQQILLALRFYATGSLYITMGDFGGVHKTTAGKIIKNVTAAILHLRPIYVKFPDTELGLALLQQDFYDIARFLRVLGAFDCTHIKIQSPGGDNAEHFRNRKGYFSLNVQVVCNAKCEILDIVARWPGASHDSHIFDNSGIRMRFEFGEMGRHLFLGDSGYPVRPYLITPLRNPQTPTEPLFNECQIRTRLTIERTFGMWKRRFQVLSMGMRCKLALCQDIIVATAILYNIAKQNNDVFDNVEDIIEEQDFHIEQRRQNNNENDEVRLQLLDYFETLL